ncbi:MAG: zinc ribbon domain-containing protein [Candidatus Zixiibacteriota bacterium]|nr:MAG: zinc ribbon domain-containing protein [candidate division Zixibacteria bacterium]
MPLFEYKCSKCGKQFEELVASDRVEVTCTGCGSPEVTRLLSVFASTGSSKSSPPTPCGKSSCNAGFT